MLGEGSGMREEGAVAAFCVTTINFQSQNLAPRASRTQPSRGSSFTSQILLIS